VGGVILAAASGACVTPFEGPAHTEAPPASDRSGMVDTEAASPPATGDHITLKRWPCYGTCATYEVTVYATGAVRWYGYDHVRQLGAARGAVSEAQARALLDGWRRLRHDELPDSQVSCVSDPAFDEVTAVIDGVSVTRWLDAMYGFGCDDRDDEDTELCRGIQNRWAQAGFSYDQLVAFDMLIREINAAVDLPQWVATEPCMSTILPVDPTIQAFRASSPPRDERLAPVEYALTLLERDRASVVRLHGIETTDGSFHEKLQFHRDALMGAGIDEDRILVTTLPHQVEPPGSLLVGHGRIQVGPRSCFPPSTRPTTTTSK
jgi:hypothetical protein